MAVLNAWGVPVSSCDKTYLAVHDLSGGWLGGDHYLPNPNYDPSGCSPPVCAPPPPVSVTLSRPPTKVTITRTVQPGQVQFAFDTIGQVIYRSIGSVRLPMRLIWIQGISESGQTIPSDGVITFAGAICAPFDQGEVGHIADIVLGDEVIFTAEDGVAVPSNITDPLIATQLTAAITGMVVYPGTEGQIPDPLILADRGVKLTPAFRGMRYTVFKDWPVSVPFNNLSFIYNRTSAGLQGQPGTSTPVCRTSTPQLIRGFSIATGDICCATAFTVNGAEWVLYGSEEMGDNGDIFGGIAARQGTDELFLMYGDANLATATGFPASGLGGGMVRYFKVPFGNLVISAESLPDWTPCSFTPDPLTTDFTSQFGSHAGSICAGLAHNLQTNTFYALIWVNPTVTVIAFPDMHSFLYQSPDGINYDLIQTFATQTQGIDALRAAGSVESDINNASSKFPTSASVTNPRGELVTVRVQGFGAQVQFGVGADFIDIEAFSDVRAVCFGNGRFVIIGENLEFSNSGYSDDYGETWQYATIKLYSPKAHSLPPVVAALQSTAFP